MKDSSFDHHIKNRLQHHQASVPADMWERINKKKRRYGFVPRLYMLILALLLVGATVLLVADNRTKPTAVHTTIAIERTSKNSRSDQITATSQTKTNRTKNTAAKHDGVQQPVFISSEASASLKKRIPAASALNREHHPAQQYGGLKKLLSRKRQQGLAFSKPGKGKKKKHTIFETNAVATDNTIPRNDKTIEKQQAPTQLATQDTATKKAAAALDALIETAPPPPAVLEAGVQWQVPLPLTGGAYFDGARGTPQPYAILIPGAWLSVATGRNRLLFDVQPFATALLSDKAFYTLETGVDSATRRTTTKTARKVFGITAGLSYHYNIDSRWWAGGSLQGAWWRNALITTTQADERRDATNHIIATKTITKNTATIDGVEVPFLKFQWFTNAELLYKAQRWEAGLRTGVAFIPLADSDGPKNTLQAGLYFRWGLASKKLFTR